MFKSKLQELCQKRKWALPNYAHFSDNRPNFKASVVVHGITFNSPPGFTSSKQAQNKAAELAYFHFTSEPSDQRGKGVEKMSSTKKEVEGSTNSEDITVEHFENLEKRDEFKNKLEMYAKKKNLNLPVYCNEKEGLCFTAQVSIGGEWFRSLEPCGTVDEAQDSAAQSALLSLSTNAFLQNDPCSYKIPPLHEPAKSSEGFFMPPEKRSKLFHQPGHSSPRFSDDDMIFKPAPPLGSVVISDPQESPKSGSQVQEITGGDGDIIYNKGKESAKAYCGKIKSTEAKNYLLGNRVEVFTSIPNMAPPEGTVLLPIKENMWKP